MKLNRGFYGNYGGQFVPETLIPALDRLEDAFRDFTNDAGARAELADILHRYAGRPTPLYHAKRLSARAGVDIYLKREDLLHTGAHKINNTLGQAMLARSMGKPRVIAETGAGQHGVASATAAALFGLQCTVYMGNIDVIRQSKNVEKMTLLGAEVRPVKDGQQTLKEAVSAALRDWVERVQDTHYLIGSAVGPHPFPRIVRHFQSVIGDETREQCRADSVLPAAVIACVGGGSNAIGMFGAFLDDPSVELVGVEAGGRSIAAGDHASTLGLGSPGIFQGSLSYLLCDRDGIIRDVHSVSAGLDYPGVGPEHAFLKDAGRVSYTSVNDGAALDAFRELIRLEGIIPALESSHALAWVLQNANAYRGRAVVVCLSGRGDKDIDIVRDATGGKL